MAAQIDQVLKKSFKPAVIQARRRLLRPSMTAQPAASVYRGSGFAPRFLEGAREEMMDVWRPLAPRSAGTAWSVATILTGEYHKDGAQRGWTPGRFFSVLAAAVAAAGGGTCCRSREKYAALLFGSGFFVPVRRGGGQRGAILRVFLDPCLLADEGRRIRQRGELKRAQDAARKRRARRTVRHVCADTRRAEPPIAQTVLDQIDLELAQIGDSTATGFVVRPSAEDVRLTRPANAPTSEPKTSSSPMAFKKQIPLTPTPAAQGRQDFPCESIRKADEPASFTSPEALEDHLYRFVASQPLSAGPKLKEQVGPVVYQGLQRAHPYGIQGLKQLAAEEVRRLCRRVAAAHCPKPTTERQRAARFRLKIDRRANSASAEAIREAADAILGPGTAAGLNPRHLAYHGLSLPAVEAVLGRGQRCLKVGSRGPGSLRTPGALNAYFLTAFRQENRVHGRPAGGVS